MLLLKFIAIRSTFKIKFLNWTRHHNSSNHQMIHLPLEIILHIISYLSIKQSTCLLNVSVKMRSIIKIHAFFIYRVTWYIYNFSSSKLLGNKIVIHFTFYLMTQLMTHFKPIHLFLGFKLY